jgi:uncharacterized membrane protein YfhO
MCPEQEEYFLEDLVKYSAEELEVLKESCEKEIEDISKTSLMLKLSRKFGIDLYEVLRKAILVNMIILICFFVISFAIMFSTPREEIVSSPIEGILIGGTVIVAMPLIAIAMLLGTDKRVPLYNKLHNINRILKSKNEVTKRIQKQKPSDKNYQIDLDISNEKDKRKIKMR